DAHSFPTRRSSDLFRKRLLTGKYGHPWKKYSIQIEQAMAKRDQIFLRQSAEKVKDLSHRQKMNHALKQSDDAFERGKAQFSNLELARDWAHAIKREEIGRASCRERV